MAMPHPTCPATHIHIPEIQAFTLPSSISWGLPHEISPRFGDRLIQSRYRFDFLSERTSLIGK